MSGKISSIALCCDVVSTALTVLLFTATAAHAALVISSAPTQNMSCSGGVCTAAAKDAVLNAGDLQNLLAAGSATVATGTAARDIDVRAALTWVSANTLSLDANRSIVVNQPVSAAGSGGVTIFTNNGGKGGTLSFGANGNVTFWSTSDRLEINGASYALVDNIATLASGIAANPGGNYALANSYDASIDGTYDSSPVDTVFSGSFQGLGNSV